MLTPTGTFCEDAWLTTAALLRETDDAEVPGGLPARRGQPGARRADGGGVPADLRRPADAEHRHRRRADASRPASATPRSKDERYARTEEFLTVAARHLDARRRTTSPASTTTSRAPGQRQRSTRCRDIYFGGSSGPAGPVAAEHADVYLTWGEPPELVAEKIALDARRSPPSEGRTLRFGLRLHTLSRDTSEEAWAHAQWLLDGLDPADRSPQAQAGAAARASRPASSGCWRCAAGARRTPTRASSRSHPNLWSGVGLVRGGAGTALVGSHEEVAERLEEYHALGIDEFILSGYPHVEEAYWFAEGVMPVLRGTRGPRRARRRRRWRRRPEPALDWGVWDAGTVDDASWAALTLSLTVAGGIWTWFAFRDGVWPPACGRSASRCCRSAAYLTKTLADVHRHRRRDRRLGQQPGLEPDGVERASCWRGIGVGLIGVSGALRSRAAREGGRHGAGGPA